MSTLQKFNTTKTNKLGVLIEVVAEYEDTINIDALTELYQFNYEKLNGSIGRISKNLANKKISVILNMLLTDVTNILDNENVFLEKYLISNINPYVTNTVVTSRHHELTLKEEMLALFRMVGARNTALIYLLVVYHSS